MVSISLCFRYFFAGRMIFFPKGSGTLSIYKSAHVKGCGNHRPHPYTTLCITCIIPIWHEKTDLKFFVVVIPKEGWARLAVPILLSVWHRHLRIWLYWHHRLYSWKVGVMPKEGWAWPRTPTLKSVFSWHAQYMLIIIVSDPWKMHVWEGAISNQWLTYHARISVSAAIWCAQCDR